MFLFCFLFPQILDLLANFECKNGKNLVLTDVQDFKEFKKLMRTRTNILTLFCKSTKSCSSASSVFQNVASEIKGHGTMIQLVSEL